MIFRRSSKHQAPEVKSHGEPGAPRRPSERPLNLWPGLPLYALQRTAGNAAVAGEVERLKGQFRSPTLQRGLPDVRPQPESTAFDVTGRWDIPNADADQRITLHLNQAGSHVEGWYLRREMQPSPRFQRLYRMRLEADLVESGAKELTFSHRRHLNNQSLSGQLSFRKALPNDTLDLREPAWHGRFQRKSTSARLSDEALSAMPDDVRALITAHQTTPLDDHEERHIDEACGDLRKRIEAYVNTRGRGAIRWARAGSLNKLVLDRIGIFHPDQRPLVQFRVRQMLTKDTLSPELPARSVWDWLQVVVLEHPDQTSGIRSLLDIASPARTASGERRFQNKYEWHFVISGGKGGFHLKGSGYLGKLVVKKTAPETWEHSYWTAFGGLHGGVSYGASGGVIMITEPSKLESPISWEINDFPGPYVVTGSDASVTGANLGFGGGYALIIFYGDRSLGSLVGDASGVAIALGKLGFSVGADIGVSYGRIFATREETIESRRTKPQEIDTTARYQTTAETHFAVAQPELTSAGRSEIRKSAALHRATLENPATVVAIDGYASPTGSVEFNDRLSQLRAEHVRQALVDILPSSPAINASQAVGHGFHHALAAGVEMGTETAVWRLATVSIDGRIVLRLR